MDAREMLEQNLKAIELNKPLVYSKAEHSQSERCNAIEKIEWNKYLPQAEQYTKDEIDDEDRSSF